MRIPWLLTLCAWLTIAGSVQGASDSPKRGGTLTVAIGRDLGLMHPLIGTTGNEQKTRELMFESLLAVDSTGKIQPNLAESWEISDKGKLYTFNLRKGVRFHNGQEMTGEDVKYAVDYSVNPKNSAYGLNYLGLVERVEVGGKYAVQFHLKKPSPLFLAALADIQAFSVVPKGSLPEGITKVSQFPPGTGPFKFVEWQPGQRIVFERYEGYWGHKAFVDRLILRPIADETIRFISLQSGAAAQEADVPLGMHTTTGGWKRAKFHHRRIQTFVRGQGEIQTTLMELVYGGVFDRFPRLKIVAAEWDIGWVAHMVGKFKDHDPRTGLKLAPAEYFRRNVWFTFENDRAGALTTPFYGANQFLWASDYPHGATTWPDSHTIVDRQFEGVSEDIKRRVVRQNAIDLYKLGF